MMCRALEKISERRNKSYEPSLLQKLTSNTSFSLTFYQNDILNEHAFFKDQFVFFKDHFFSRIEWTRLKLSFKKLYLFQTSIKTLKIQHLSNDKFQIVQNRIRKIVNFFVPVNQIGVRAFLNTIDIIHKWVPNFSKISRLLTRLTEKMDWRQIVSKQLTFEILRIKCSTVTMMYEYDYSLPIHFYTNASLNDDDLIITQFQKNNQNDEKSVKVSILYNSVIFNFTERRYPTYKRELCALIKFVHKYDHFCKHSKNTAIIHIDHKSLIHFLKTDSHENIYDHWTNKLRKLNLKIIHISKRRNKIADDLFRILFWDENCDLQKKWKKHWKQFEKTSNEYEKMTKKNIRFFWKIYNHINALKWLSMKFYQKKTFFHFRFAQQRRVPSRGKRHIKNHYDLRLRIKYCLKFVKHRWNQKTFPELWIIV